MFNVFKQSFIYTIYKLYLPFNFNATKSPKQTRHCSETTHTKKHYIISKLSVYLHGRVMIRKRKLGQALLIEERTLFL